MKTKNDKVVEKETDWIPAIIQDETTQVLMLGFMNEEALKLTEKNRKSSLF